MKFGHGLVCLIACTLIGLLVSPLLWDRHTRKGLSAQTGGRVSESDWELVQGTEMHEIYLTAGALCGSIWGAGIWFGAVILAKLKKPEIVLRPAVSETPFRKRE